MSAYHAGIIKGQGEQDFGPNHRVTREEAAAMLLRALAVKQHTGVIDLLTSVGNGSNSGFEDVSDWARPYFDAAATAGFLEGNGEGEWIPKSSLTRAEAAQTILRLLNK